MADHEQEYSGEDRTMKRKSIVSQAHMRSSATAGPVGRQRALRLIRRGAAVVVFLSAVSAVPRTKLTTLPNRMQVRIDLKNPDRALVEEERTINLQQGSNQIEFAWANTHIDKESIRFRPIRTPGKVSVLNVNYPPGETALFWECHAEKAGPAIFRISYLMGNIQRGMSYEAVAERSEKTLAFQTFINLRNDSGEQFRNAKLELTIGKTFRRTLNLGEGRKILAAGFPAVPIAKSYRFDRQRTGEYVRMYYELQNGRKHGMGQFDLPRGKVRIYQKDSAGTQAFLGEDWGDATPVDRKMLLFLGQAKEVKVERRLISNVTEWVNNPVKNIRQRIRLQIENFKDSAVPLTVLEHPGGEWEITGLALKELHGERNARVEKVIKHEGLVRATKKDTDNLVIDFQVAPTRTRKIKYVLYVDIVLKNRW